MTLTDTEKLIEEVRTINGEIEELQLKSNDIVKNCDKLFYLIIQQQKVIDLLYAEVFKEPPLGVNYNEIWEQFQKEKNINNNI